VKTPGNYRFGPFEVRPGAREILKNGTPVKLRGQPYLILEALLERAGEVVTREEIRQKLWSNDTFVDVEHGLNTSVKKLRQILCDSVEEPRYIETIPRLGYRFIAPVKTIAEANRISADQGAPELVPLGPLTSDRQLTGDSSPPPVAHPVSSETPPVTLEPGQPSRSFRNAPWLGFTAALLLYGVVVGIAVNTITRTLLLRSLKSPHSTKQLSSIAVLPLQNLSGDSSQEYFVDGMTDELISDLAQVSGLRVISRTSVMHYKNGNKTAPQIGRELGVDALVEGTVERDGNRVRIRVQLIDTAADRHLWAKTYDYELKDVLALQGSAARDVAAEIQGRAKGTPNEASTQSHSVNGRAIQPDAYEAYLKGRYFWNQRNEEAVKKSIGYFEQATAKDSSFAAAYAGLAASYSLLSSDVLPADVAQAKARAAAAKALELDPSAAEGHAELGEVEFYYDWNWKGAEQEFQRAIQLNPNYATAHQSYSYYLRAMGRLPEALQEAMRAQQLDPLSLAISTTVAGRYRDLGQYDRAIAVNQRTLELDPNFGPAHQVLASIYEQQGNFLLAIAEWQKALELSHGNRSVLAALGHAYGIAGNQAEARKILGQLQPLSKQHYVPAWDMAVLFAGLGDADHAFQCLQESYRERDSQMPFLNQDRRFASLRADPRFQNLLRKVGLQS